MNRFEPPPLPGADRPAQEPENPYATPTGGTSHSSAPAYGPSGAYSVASQAPWGLPASYNHPRGTTVLVLGILSVVMVPVLGPFAWAMGRRALREADAAPHPTANRSTLQAGMVLGILGTVFMLLGLLWVLAVMGIVVTTAMTGM